MWLKIIDFRYYATVPWLQWKNLSRCCTKLKHFCKNYHLYWIAGRANILCKYVIYIFFSIFWVVFAVLFLCCFQKLRLLVVKKFWNNFCSIVLLFVLAQNGCLRLLKSYFKLEILIFLSFLFWRKTHQRWNLRHTLVEKLSKINVGKY